ncbi:MAG: tetratricopeptide repeat protein, partial [Myxococcota bacterium]
PNPPPRRAPGKQKAQEHVEAGNRALLTGNFSEAVAQMQRALDADPGNLDAMIGLGIASVRVGKPCDGLKYYRRARDTSPNSPKVDRVKSLIKDLEREHPDCK